MSKKCTEQCSFQIEQIPRFSNSLNVWNGTLSRIQGRSPILEIFGFGLKKLRSRRLYHPFKHGILWTFGDILNTFCFCWTALVDLFVLGSKRFDFFSKNSRLCEARAPKSALQTVFSLHLFTCMWPIFKLPLVRWKANTFPPHRVLGKVYNTNKNKPRQ